MPVAPSLTAEQRQRALAEAAAARAARARVRTALKAGDLTLAEVLRQADTDPQLAGMRVTALVSALPGFGDARTAQLLAELRIAASRRVRGLGPKQRDALLARISDPAESKV